MASIDTLGIDTLSIRGANQEYNRLTRFYRTRAEAEAAIGEGGDWNITAGVLNACLTGDEGLLVYDEVSETLTNADSATKTYVDAQLAALTGDAPELLDTLGELSDALGDDPAFFTTMANANATLQSNIDAVQADVDQNEADADAALVEVNQDVVDINAALGIVENDSDMGIFVTPTFDDNHNLKTVLENFGVLYSDRQSALDLTISNLQSDVDGNESDSDAAESALSGRLDTLEADPTTATAVAAVQADVDQNEADADAADAALSGRLDTLEADPTTATALAAVQADVDQNESDSDAAEAALSGRLDTLEADPVTKSYVDGTTTAEASARQAADDALDTRLDVLEADATTKTYVDAQVSGLIDAAPGALDTLNELAAAMGDDANFATTVTNQIAVVQADVDQNEADADAAIALKANLAGAAFTGDISTTGNLDVSGNLQIDNDGGYYIHFDRNNATQLDLATGNIPSGGNLNIKNSNGTDARVVVYSDQFWVRNLGGANGNGTAKFDGAVIFGDTISLNGTTVTASGAELNYVDGVTSNIQTQLDAKLASAGAQSALSVDHLITLSGVAEAADDLGTFTGSTISDSGTIKAALQELETAVEATPAAATASDTVKTQIAANSANYFLTFVDSNNASATAEAIRTGTALKFNPSTKILDLSSGTVHAKYLTLNNVNVDATADELNVLDGITATTAELNYTDGVTSNIQTQLDTIQADVDQNESDADAAIAAVLAGTSIPGPYNNDSDAGTGGVAVGALYKNSNGSIHWRVS